MGVYIGVADHPVGVMTHSMGAYICGHPSYVSYRSEGILRKDLGVVSMGVRWSQAWYGL